LSSSCVISLSPNGVMIYRVSRPAMRVQQALPV
jgi:hypothetical protein